LFQLLFKWSNIYRKLVIKRTQISCPQKLAIMCTQIHYHMHTKSEDESHLNLESSNHDESCWILNEPQKYWVILVESWMNPWILSESIKILNLVSNFIMLQTFCCIAIIVYIIYVFNFSSMNTHIDLFHIIWKYNVIIHIQHFGRQQLCGSLLMPATCVVVGCHNRHSKDNNFSFYCFPTDSEKQCRWISFDSWQNADEMPLEPGEWDWLCSEHFISGKKSDLPCGSDCVPSIYPLKVVKKSSQAANVESLACFEWAQHCSTTNEKERLAKEREEERNFIFTQQALKTMEHDHSAYCSSYKERPSQTVEQVVSFCCQLFVSQNNSIEEQLLSIPLEAGTVDIYHCIIIYYCHCRMSNCWSGRPCG